VALCLRLSVSALRPVRLCAWGRKAGCACRRPVGGRSACACAAALRGCAPGEARRLRPAAVPARALRGCALRGRALGAQAAAGGTRESGARPAGGS